MSNNYCDYDTFSYPLQSKSSLLPFVFIWVDDNENCHTSKVSLDFLHKPLAFPSYRINLFTTLHHICTLYICSTGTTAATRNL